MMVTTLVFDVGPVPDGLCYTCEGLSDVGAVPDGLTIPDMLPHNGDHCGEGLSDVGAVSDGLHSPLYLTCSLMMVTTVVRASMMLVLFLMVSARSLSTSSATAFLFRYT